MLHLKRAAIIVGFLLPGLSIAQTSIFHPGYIVRTEAPTDTVRGYVDTFFAAEKKGIVRFRTTQDAATEQTFTAAQLAAAGAGTQEVYVTRQIPIGDRLQPRFLQVVVSGEASLFKTQSNEQQARYFIEQRGKQTMPLRRGQYLQVLQNTLAGCSAIAKAITSNRTRYSYQLDDLRRAVQQYNACTTPPQPEQVYSGPPKPGKQLGVRVGMQSSAIYYPQGKELFNNQKPETHLDPTVGIFWKLNLSPRIAFVPELLYGRSRSTQSVTIRPGASNDYYIIQQEIEASYVRLPFTMRYTFGRPGRRVRPYLEGGYVAGAAFGTKSRYAQIPAGTVNVDRTRTEDYTVERLMLGYHAGAGIDFHSSFGVWGISARAESLSLNSSYVVSYIYVDTRCLTLTYTWR